MKTCIICQRLIIRQKKESFERYERRTTDSPECSLIYKRKNKLGWFSQLHGTV